MTRVYAFATGGGVKTIHWKQETPLEWEEFVEWLALDAPADHKVCGGYVAGELQLTTGHLGNPDCVGLHRNKRAVECRSMLTLDVDHAGEGFAVDVMMKLGCALAMYTTWSSTPESPRWRLILPLSEDVKPEDYRLLADAVMMDLGASQFDTGSREPERLMHRPSNQGGHYYSHVVEGEPLDVAVWMERVKELGLTAEKTRRAYEGEELYADLTHDQQVAADELVQERVEAWRKVWAEAIGWEEGKADDKGRGWERLTRDCAWAFAKMAATPWMSLDEDAGRELFESVVPSAVLETPECAGKWDDALLVKAGEAPVDPPPWGDFDVWEAAVEPSALESLRDDYQPWDINSDLQLGKRVAREYLSGRYLAWGHTRWARWDGRRWDINVSDDQINGDIREALLDIRKKEIREADRKRDRAMAGGDAEAEKAAMKAHEERMKVVARLAKVGILEAAKKMSRPDLAVRLEDFDGPETADLLNCGNGVVDLKTGVLVKHDPALKFTKMTSTNYVPGAMSPDWDKCLGALPEDVLPWVCKKLGQGATGHPPTDEIVMFMRGGGENGKTTFLLGVRQALGDFYVTVPDKVLNASPGDHSTEFMPLKGARLAVIEELPDGEWLTGTRLKKAEGSETGMTARPIGQDNVTWAPSHCLVATTNYLIQITDIDHGTRRRLCDLNFPRTFSGEERDPELKLRMKLGKTGQHEAALAWLVEGAKASYAEPLQREHMPVSVRADTDAWLMGSNVAEEFMSTALVYSPGSSVLTKDLYSMYKEWAIENGRRPLNDTNFWSKAEKTSLFKMDDVRRLQARDHGDLVTRDGLPRTGPQRLVVAVTWSSEYREHILGFS